MLEKVLGLNLDLMCSASDIASLFTFQNLLVSIRPIELCIMVVNLGAVELR